MNYEPFTIIENPTLVHFRHFSSLFTNLPSTSVETPLQINPFYAKQTQFPKKSNDVSFFYTMDYENKSDRTLGENKPNSNPISETPKMSANAFSQKDYENKTALRSQKNKPKQTQFQTQRLSKLFLAFTFLCPSYNLAMQTWTIQKLLNWVTEYLAGKGIDSPRLSAELLLSGVLAMKRIELYTKFDKPGASRFVQLSFFRTPAKMRNVPCQSTDSGLF